MKNRISILIIILLVGFSGCSQKAVYEITGEELLEHVSFLASDDLAGRYPGTDGDRDAANYIAEQFERYGLDVSSPAGLQAMEVTTSVVLGDSNRLAWKDLELEVRKDYIPLSYTKNDEVRGEIVYAGFGIVKNNSSLPWDDFKGVDLKDKIALILEGGPEAPEESSDPLRSKILMAQDRGAIAVIFVSGPMYTEADNLQFTKNKEAPSGIPAIRISRDLAERILETSGEKLESLEKKAMEASLGAKALGEVAFLKTHVISEKVETYNIIGILNAPDGPCSDEYVVFGAHYDHLGMGGPGTSTLVPDTVAVHYGADDNASGTTGVIELAGYFAGIKSELKRSMIFVAFAAEEMGLLGSDYFVDNPPVELEKIAAMINLDMIGRLNEEHRFSIGGTGTAAEFDSLLSAVDAGSLELSFSPEGSGPSDHASFYAKDIPVLFMSTGAHPDYHTPGDSVGSLNIEGMKIVTDYVAELSGAIAQQDELSFREAGPKRNMSQRQNLKVELGFMPDFTDNSNTGMRVGFPTPGKPAARAGIKKGDRIIGINGLKVTNIQDYMVRLQSLEPGQIVTVELMRDDEKIVLLVQL